MASLHRILKLIINLSFIVAFVMTSNNQTTTATTLPQIKALNNTILYQRCAPTNKMCQNFGACYESLTRPTIQFCRCHMNFYGDFCEKEDTNKYKKVLFGVALLAGIILIFAIAASCQLYMKSGDAKDARQSYDYLASTLQRYRKDTRTTTLSSFQSDIVRPVRPISLSASSYKENDRLRSDGGGSISPSSFYSDHEAYVRNISPSVIVTVPENKSNNATNSANKAKNESESVIDCSVFEVDEERPRSTTVSSTAELIINDYTGVEDTFTQANENKVEESNNELNNNDADQPSEGEIIFDKTKLHPTMSFETNFVEKDEVRKNDEISSKNFQQAN